MSSLHVSIVHDGEMLLHHAAYLADSTITCDDAL